MTIERLNYTAPPPDYQVRNTSYEDGDDEVGGYGVNIEEWTWSAHGYMDSAEDEEQCIASAWRNYKDDNDPPGMSLTWEPDDQHFEPLGSGEWHASVIAGDHERVVWWRRFSSQNDVDGQAPSDIARAAAWAWYDRRLTLLTRCESEQGVNSETWSIDYWPEALTWSDEQVAEVERWLVDSTAEMPEVLRDPPTP